MQNNRINEYYANSRINSSKLKRIWNEPFWVQGMLNNPGTEDDESQALRIGGAVDTALTDSDNFIKLYAVSEENRPGGKMGKFIDNLPLEIDEDSDPSLYEKAYKEADYNISIERVIDQLWKNNKYRQFFLARKAALGKQVLSQDEYQIVINAKKAIMESRFALPYFINNDSFKELYHQIPVYFKYAGVECKAMLDGLIIDHKAQTLRLFDLKTTGRKVHNFEWSYLSYSYYFQVAFYHKALEMLLSGNGTTPVDIDIDLIADYTLLPPQFVVVSKSEFKSFVQIYEVSEIDLACGLNGGNTTDGRYMPGVRDLVLAFQWHKENDIWDCPKRVYENNGVEVLSLLS